MRIDPVPAAFLREVTDRGGGSWDIRPQFSFEPDQIGDFLAFLKTLE